MRDVMPTAEREALEAAIRATGWYLPAHVMVVDLREENEPLVTLRATSARAARMLAAGDAVAVILTAPAQSSAKPTTQRIVDLLHAVAKDGETGSAWCSSEAQAILTEIGNPV